MEIASSGESRPASSSSVLVAVVMLAVGMGGGVVVIWLVLAPKYPAGAADEELRVHRSRRRSDGSSISGRRAVDDRHATTFRFAAMAEQRPLVRQAHGWDARLSGRDDLAGVPHMMAAPAVIQAGHRLRCAHNAASVAVSHAQPLEDVMQVRLDRPFGDVELAGDLTIVEPGLHQDEDFAFTRGEEFGGTDPAAAGVEQDSGDDRVERQHPPRTTSRMPSRMSSGSACLSR